MKILFLIDSLEGGGAERASLNIARLLSKENEVSYVTLFDADNPGYCIASGITCHHLHIRKNHRLISKPALYCREIFLLKRLKRQIRPDVCISFLETANFLNVLSRTEEKTIISIRNYYSRSLWQERILIQKIKASFAGRHADSVVCVSEEISRDMAEHYRTPKDRMHVIYNMYEPEQYTAEPDEEIMRMFRKKKDQASVTYITAGRYVKQKGQRHLIRAFRRVRQEIPDAVLFLFGQGPLEEELRNVIRENQLEEAVFLMGFDPAVMHYLRDADVYVCSSLWEGFSNSLLEAMASGLPVISADCRSGPRELLAPDTDPGECTEDAEYAAYGVLTPVCTGNDVTDEPLEKAEEILADVMIRLGKDEQLREHFRMCSAERIRDFSTEKIMRQWTEVIRSAVNGGEDR